jgi:hypothetical protein
LSGRSTEKLVLKHRLFTYVHTTNGVDYSRVRYFERVAYLRSTGMDGSILPSTVRPAAKSPWLKPTEPAGTTFESHIDQCTNTGRVEERGAEVVTPSARFVDTVEISFRGNCADAGTTRQVYAAGVGT